MKQMINLLNANIKLFETNKDTEEYNRLKDFIITDYCSEEFELKLSYITKKSTDLIIQLKELEQLKLRNNIYCKNNYINNIKNYCEYDNFNIEIINLIENEYINLYKNIIKYYGLDYKKINVIFDF